MNSSIRWAFTGWLVGCTIKQSLPADVFIHLHDQFPVGEQFGAAIAQRNLEIRTDLLRQCRIARPVNTFNLSASRCDNC